MKNKDKLEIKVDWPLLGNRHIVEFLEKSIVNQKISGSYVFLGPDNLGKTTTAKYFAQVLLCQERNKESTSPCLKCPSCKLFHSNGAVSSPRESAHGDFHVLKRDKDKKNISISQIREFIKNLSMSSMMGNAKVGIIKHADTLSLEAANALLKTLEEPKSKVVIIMVAQSGDNLPNTILSRSQIFTFRPIASSTIHDYLVEVHGLTRSQAKNYSRLALGRPALAVKFFEDENFRELYKTRMVAFVNFYKQDINRRFGSIDDLIPSRDKGQPAVVASERTLEIWQGLLRDFLLEKKGLYNLMQHEIIRTEIESVTKRLNSKTIIKDMKIIDQARKFLSANVNPRAVVENVLINIG